MTGLFKERSSRFGSLVSLIAVTAMLAVFFLSLPVFLVSFPGRTFVAAWSVVAIVILIAHARNVAGLRHRRPITYSSSGRPQSPQKTVQRAVSPLRG
ncbi:hypothetical protein [Anaeroselena agilis]|uniref:Uncharacterized protein n=1 Tax=Anaeroselena agilis TaxID=3063788 RepID=A0ABU3NUU4_9FIRM|nr:hypothetical protein [Selenomonadales bacterium 4137-cl]